MSDRYADPILDATTVRLALRVALFWLAASAALALVAGTLHAADVAGPAAPPPSAPGPAAAAVPDWASLAMGPLGAVMALLFTWRVVLPKREAELSEARAEIARLHEARFKAVKDDHDESHEAILQRLDKQAASLGELAEALGRHTLALADLCKSLNGAHAARSG